MTLKSYTQQIVEHIDFLRSKGFCLQKLKIDQDFVSHRRGEHCYKTWIMPLDESTIEILTWSKIKDTEHKLFKTRGFKATKEEAVFFETAPLADYAQCLRDTRKSKF